MSDQEAGAANPDKCPPETDGTAALLVEILRRISLECADVAAATARVLGDLAQDRARMSARLSSSLETTKLLAAQNAELRSWYMETMQRAHAAEAELLSAQKKSR